LADVSLPIPGQRPRWRPGWRKADVLKARARWLLLVRMLFALGLVWCAAQAIADEAQNCDTRTGKLYDRMSNRFFKTPLRCGCDGRLDLSTGCALGILP
jgi:hypothetical protein